MLTTACTDRDPPPIAPSYLPPLPLVTLDKQPLDLAHYRGRLLVLNVWATWCKPCRKELPGLQTLAQSMDPSRFVFILLSVDEDDHVAREYLRDKQIHLLSAWDPAGTTVISQLGVDRFPYTFLVDRDGQVVGRIAGERVWDTQAWFDQLEALYAGSAQGLIE